MIAEEDFDVVAEVSPEMAFVRLEHKFRAAYERNIEGPNSPEAFNHYRVEYMNHTVEAAQALGLDFLNDFEVPGEYEDSAVVSVYKDLRQYVDAFIVRTRIRHVRSGSGISVALDSSEKKHVRAYAGKIKDIIDKSSLLPAKKERLFDKINAFIAELDKDRTGLQKFTDVVLSLARTVGEATKELEPAWKWAHLIAEILGVRQESEQTKLPAPPKKLEPPKRRLPPPPQKASRSEMNDEVPF